MTEARRIARQIVKDQIKAAGEKVSHYTAKAITEAANGLIEADPTILETAKANLAAASKKVGDQAKAKAALAKAGIKVDPKLVAKAEAAKKEKKKEAVPLSAKQAAIPAKPQAKGQRPHA